MTFRRRCENERIGPESTSRSPWMYRLLLSALASTSMASETESCADDAQGFVCQEYATVAEGVTALPMGAFKGCTVLREVSLPSTLVEIGPSAFSGCTSLHAIALPDGVQRIGAYAFSQTRLKTLVLPRGLHSLNMYAFNEVRTLEMADLASTQLTAVAVGVFWGCTALRTVTLPERLESIRQAAFYTCTALQDIRLPEGLLTIEEHAFRDCTSLSSLTIPARLRFLGVNAFKGSSALFDEPAGVQRGETDDD